MQEEGLEMRRQRTRVMSERKGEIFLNHLLK